MKINHKLGLFKKMQLLDVTYVVKCHHDVNVPVGCVFEEGARLESPVIGKMFLSALILIRTMVVI